MEKEQTDFPSPIKEHIEAARKYVNGAKASENYASKIFELALDCPDLDLVGAQYALMRVFWTLSRIYYEGTNYDGDIIERIRTDEKRVQEIVEPLPIIKLIKIIKN